MENQITTPQMFVELRSGITITMDEVKVESFMKEVERCKFVKVNGEYINTVDISGVFKPSTINDRNKKKAGRTTWTCEKHNNVIQKGQKCGYCESGFSRK